MKERVKNRRSKSAWKLGTALAFLFCLCGCWLVFDSLFAPFSKQGARVEIPDYRGAMRDDLQFEPWMQVETEYRYDGDTPAGTVLGQSPAGGSFRKLSPRYPTCRISLTVSLGREHATLPNVVGMESREAEALLRGKGFAVQVKRSAGAYPEGEVFAMEPKGGAELPLGSTVTLSVSAGTPTATVTVPDLRGLSRAEALMRLWSCQLAVDQVVEEPSSQPEGTVLRQSHQPGTLVSAGTRVTLYVSSAF